MWPPRGRRRRSGEGLGKTGHGRIELQPFNTVSGIDAVANGSADIAGSARGSYGSAQKAGLTSRRWRGTRW